MLDLDNDDLQSLFRIVRILRESYSNGEISHNLFPDEKEYIKMGIRPYLNHAMDIRGIKHEDNSLQIFFSKYKELITNHA